MRPTAQLFILFSLLLLVSGCQNFDPTHFWKLNRGENYMNDDAHFSVPARPLPSTLHQKPNAPE